MFEPRTILWFAVRSLLYYVVLVAPWPGVQDTYATGYRGVANAMFGSYGQGGVVRFQPLTGGGDMDTTITVRTLGSPEKGTMTHNTRIMGYRPTAELIALILATPIPWSRRWKALAWGLLLVNAFIALRIIVTLTHCFSADATWALYHPTPFWSKILAGTFHVMTVAPSWSWVIPALIWILVCFRRDDWARLQPDAKAP